jgi:D-alanyl-D-alanine-carboxypeptidase/D-alanyl-D-alanine-endopeptidase
MIKLLRILALLACTAPLHAQPAAVDARHKAYADIDPVFRKWMAENHVPGLVYAVVVDGRLDLVQASGVQDTTTNAPVTADTVFRIASMSKQLAALATLKLRDAGKISLDAPAERYIPQLARLRYPTSDSPKIRVRDLLSHAAGFVTDDPWGDRQLAMSEAEFSTFIDNGVPFSRAPGIAYEYSNFGYALVGRVITNVAKKNFADYIAASFKVPAGQRAIGYRWENDAWREEPVLGPGTFGAMGGLMTSANDYARYVAWVLSAWPPRDGAEDSILARASVREITRPANYATVQLPAEPTGCPRSASYGYGIIPFQDCVLGTHFGHSGGLPGYGSNVLFLPARGLAVFAFANRTYAPASRVVREAAMSLVQSQAFPARTTPPAAALAAMAATAERIYAASDVTVARDALAANFLLDRDAGLRNRELVDLRVKMGACRSGPIDSDSATSATLAWTCDRGTLKVNLLLAPTTPPTLQRLEFTP